MVKISVSLILERNFPGRTKREITDHEINALRKIDLSFASIDEIDNLEVFSDITELVLTGNNIKLVENLIFLPKLEVLDLSDNKILDFESLGLDDLPRCLRKLIISGNPCCQDNNIAASVLSKCPDLELIALYKKPAVVTERAVSSNVDADEGSMERLCKSMADVYSDEPRKRPTTASSRKAHADAVDTIDNKYKEEKDEGKGPEVDLSTEEEVEEKEDGLDVSTEYLAVDADVILKQLVGRKCEMESMEQFDINSTLEILNAESNAMKTRKRRVIIGGEGDDVDTRVEDMITRLCVGSKADSKCLYDGDSIAEWKKSCLTSNAAEAAHDADFMSALRNRMKQSAAAAREDK